MNLAVILWLFMLSFGGIASSGQGSGTSSNLPAPQTQSATTAPEAPSSQANQAAPAPSPAPAAKKRRKKKAVPSNCPATDAGTKTRDSNGPESANATTSTSDVGGKAAGQPCAPAKKVIQNGGSSEPSIQLVGGETAQQTAQQRSIDELTAATAENLKKLEGRQLPQTQEDTVKQIKQFMEQSKTAVAAGDLERGKNLATKARLLSDELVKP